MRIGTARPFPVGGSPSADRTFFCPSLTVLNVTTPTIRKGQFMLSADLRKQLAFEGPALSPEEIAYIEGRSLPTVRRLLLSGKIPGLLPRAGRLMRVDRATYLSWLRRGRYAHPAGPQVESR
jgi:hypothetical protein